MAPLALFQRSGGICRMYHHTSAGITAIDGRIHAALHLTNRALRAGSLSLLAVTRA